MNIEFMDKRIDIISQIKLSIQLGSIFLIHTFLRFLKQILISNELSYLMKQVKHILLSV